MKRFLLSAAVVVAFFSAPAAQAQTKLSTATAPANSSVAPATRPATDTDGWPTLDVWNTPADSSGWQTAATSEADPMMQSSGVLVAPGMSSSPYRGTSTDYNGRPVAKPKSKRPRSVVVASEDPMMHSSGVQIAPGMNTAPYRGVSTDYNGRPLRKPASTNNSMATEKASDNSVAAQW
ncbi:hypothetical protein SAMN06265337_3308 [Hymenobacter gelipurpurascens]|uniref:Uncharacterized protein n=1 Tax=Hymenobacter gelipurpurascens TaxID=89968 RepID=A0A212UDG2_9BACT|nr:hypothetical protein [Hymenobacter gelipurpurascens]SNC76285.1 hypothetical protein SAMN06265337_3308 [Hymenobacter gelipurpurascens]